MGYFPRFFFNGTSEQCEEFIYGGCGGNENNFEKEGDCKASCKPASAPNRCYLEKKVGHCRAAFDRYFYNKTTRKCEQFTYGGCDGNANRFMTLEECQSFCKCTCIPSEDIEPRPEICNLPPKKGLCMAWIPRYYYNTRTHTCKRFIYGGCQGNANNFETIAECKSSCMADSELETCNLPPETGPCKAAIPRYFFNPYTHECERFTYGGCQGNTNNFKTLEDCEKSCAPPRSDVEVESCNLPPKSGPCKAAIPRYYFNPRTYNCERFTYGGCRGNANNFKTLEECKASCLRLLDIVLSEYSVKSHNFRNFIFLTSHFTKAFCASKREEFVCDVFLTRLCCVASLSDSQEASCNLPPEKGRCMAIIHRYYYNPRTHNCERFIYGGCQGNANNFETVEECKMSCMRHCNLPPKTGPCKAAIPRLFTTHAPMNVNVSLMVDVRAMPITLRHLKTARIRVLVSTY
ncbi:unnamed protein product [Porites lobata]|uniref:BPTI/Kunitz inhibitor domain-containing protein n=1 Tax=Porites lobata TaxID=104759 RepID=A0ABN8NUG9_9CNID|nr:unnamed protein product [Porites lobata]